MARTTTATRPSDAHPSMVQHPTLPRRSPSRQAMQGPRKPRVLRVPTGHMLGAYDVPLVRDGSTLQLLIVVMALVVALGIALTWAGV